MNDEQKDAGTEDLQMLAALKRSFASKENAPSFDAVFTAAERRHRNSRQQFVGFAGAAVVATIAVTIIVTFNSRAPAPESDPLAEILPAVELMDSTAWTAPSDVLLPRHEFDIFRELPVLLESTESAEGALL